MAAEQEYKNMIPRSVGSDRVMRHVEELETRELNEALLFSDNGKPNMKLLRTHLSKQGKRVFILILEKEFYSHVIFKTKENFHWEQQ